MHDQLGVQVSMVGGAKWGQGSWGGEWVKKVVTYSIEILFVDEWQKTPDASSVS